MITWPLPDHYDHVAPARHSQGELVTSFEDHELWYPDAQTNNIYITTSQDLILSYCKVRRRLAVGAQVLGLIMRR
jgi:hypothetical protein